MKNKKQFDTQNLKNQAVSALKKASKYKLLAFIIFTAAVYAFVWLRINNLSNAEPSSSAVSSQVQAAQIPHIDQTVINQLQSLQDNSVSVQSLFNQARSNPFQ